VEAPQEASRVSWNHQGATRTVYVGKKYVYKVPHCTYSWKNFLMGMLANDQEQVFSKVEDLNEALCPVLFGLPLGLLVVMPRCDVLTTEEYVKHREDLLKVPLVEQKRNSFGWYQGRIVGIDYG